MRKTLVILTALVLNAVSMFAVSPAIRDIDVNVLLDPQDGSAFITEKWDVTVASGTEWYLVRHNLGAADITGLSVSDENGLFRTMDRWDIDASFEQKTGKCGLYPTGGGYEICWGVGSYGDHKYTVTYTITDAVDLLDDADLFHFQLVGAGLSSVPDHVRARIEVMDTPLDTASVKFWGFGYEGTTSLEDGALYFESDKFTRNSSLIALAAFDDGTFQGGNLRGQSLASVLDRAMEGADFGKDENQKGFFEKLVEALFFVLFFVFFLVAVVFAIGRRPGGSISRKSILGVKAKDVSWCRDIPYDGNLVNTDYTMTKLGVSTGSRNLAAAFMLRMIYKGVLRVQKDAKGKTEFALVPEADLGYMNDEEKSFYEIIEAASGEDKVLQDKEFSKWARSNSKKLYNWASPLEGTAVGNLKTDGDLNSRMKYTVSGQDRARKAFGFKKFLDDFTNMAEKQSIEAVLWQEYLVFASLFGMAEKVAGEMKDINPDIYERMMPTTYSGSIGDVIITTNNFGRHFNNGVEMGRPVPVSTGTHASSWGGHGGFSSMGGGGGFHGGGFGGGSR